MKFIIIAYAEGELPRKEITIIASGKVQAWQKAWKMFPEYHEVGVFKELCPEGINVTVLGPDRNAEFEAFKKKNVEGEK